MIVLVAYEFLAGEALHPGAKKVWVRKDGRILR